MNLIKTLDNVISESEEHTERMVRFGLIVMYDAMRKDRLLDPAKIGKYLALLDIGTQIGMDVGFYEDRLRDYLRPRQA